MKSISLNLLGFLFCAFLFASCEKDDPVIPNEEELITTLTYQLTPSDGSAIVELVFQDLDGDGPDQPVITAPALKANTTYTGSITLLNEQENPADNITLEVAEENDEHQFFFETNANGVSIAYNDQDADGNPVGLITSLTTTDTTQGTLKITLLHEPTKDATNVSNGDITNAGGEADIEVTFPISVE